MPDQYFRVSASWMQACALSEEAAIYRVIRTEADKNNQPEYDILYLDRGNYDWPVFRIRGRLVPPYTLILTRGKFFTALADVLDVVGTIRVGSEYQSIGEAQKAADGLNAALAVVRAHHED